MKFLARTALLGVLAIVLSGAGQPAPRARVQLSDTERTDLAKISDYLNTVHAMKGDFIQIADNGATVQGTFYIEKPGRVRFDYQPPSPTLVVSDGETISVVNRKLNTVNHYPLSGNPLQVLLSDKVDLSHDQSITGVDQEPGAIIVHARSNDRRRQGNITITFAAPEIELRQWTIKDSQGQVTTVALKDVQKVASLPENLFALNRPAP